MPNETRVIRDHKVPCLYFVKLRWPQRPPHQTMSFATTSHVAVWRLRQRDLQPLQVARHTTEDSMSLCEMRCKANHWFTHHYVALHSGVAM
ncbi:hypothetical protein SLA2020_450590 [Shorea laevis]